MQKIAVVNNGGIRGPATPFPQSGVAMIMSNSTSYLVYAADEIPPCTSSPTYATELAADETAVAALAGTIGPDPDPGPAPVITSLIAVAEVQPTIDGYTFDKYMPERTAALKRDSVNADLYQIELMPGDICLSIDGPSATNERCELACRTLMDFYKAYTIRYWIRIFTPAPKDPASTGAISLGNIHASPDAGDADASAPYARRIAAARKVFYDVRASTVDPLPGTPDSVYPTRYLEPAATYDRWIYIKEQHRFDPTPHGMGYHRIWHDGVLVASYQGVTGYRDVDPPYYKFGVARYQDSINTMKVQYANWTMRTPS